MQDREEKEEEEIQETPQQEDESQDLFAPTQENPFLANREQVLPKVGLE